MKNKIIEAVLKEAKIAEKSFKQLITDVAKKSGIEIIKMKRPNYTLGGHGYGVFFNGDANKFKQEVEKAGMVCSELETKNYLQYFEIQPTWTVVSGSANDFSAIRKYVEELKATKEVKDFSEKVDDKGNPEIKISFWLETSGYKDLAQLTFGVRKGKQEYQ